MSPHDAAELAIARAGDQLRIARQEAQQAAPLLRWSLTLTG
jgi:hypothetical protein